MLNIKPLLAISEIFDLHPSNPSQEGKGRHGGLPLHFFDYWSEKIAYDFKKSSLNFFNLFLNEY